MTPDKIAEGYYRFNEILCPTEGVVFELRIDRIDGEDLDTSVTLSGGFAICGSKRNEFSEKIGKLIDEYRI